MTEQECPIMTTNTSTVSRTENIYRLMLTYNKWTGLEESDRETAVRDMLADLMHLSDEYGIDFQDQLRIATDNYDAELPA
jgi:hypothetical protein